jgi:TatD DNase family protein
VLDSHCHFDDARFDDDREACVARARAAGVSRLLVPGVARSQWPRLRELSSQFGWGFAVGTHPHCVADEPFVPDDLSGARAVGECGLDGRTAAPMELQERVLLGHLELARDHGLPIILHCYKAHDRMVPLLRRFGSVRGVMHSYSGGAELVGAYVGLGLHLSFTGIVTHENARRPLNAVRAVPAHRLLVETDAPDQSPRPHHGRNEPALLPLVLAAIEAARGEPLAERIEANARELGW